MDFNSVLKKVGPCLLVILIGLFCVMGYFSPLIKGKELSQGDIDHHKGMSREIADYRAAQGEEPLWTESMFGGMPAYQISQINSGNKLAMFNNWLVTHLWVQIGYMFLMFVGLYFLLCVLKVNPWVAAAGALAYTFSSYFFTAMEAGHNSKLNAMAYAAPLIASVIVTYRGKYLIGGALTAIFTGLMVACNHYQVAYYVLFTILFLAIAEFFSVFLPGQENPIAAAQTSGKRIMTFAVASVALIIAGGLGAATDTARLWESSEYAKWSIRGNASELTVDKSDPMSVTDKGVSLDYLTQWSYGIGETFTLMVPNFKGGPSNSDFGKDSELYAAVKQYTGSAETARSFSQNGMGYWGDQPFTSGPVYVGAIICYLFLLGLIIVPGRYKWWILGVVIFSVLIAWGKNFMPFTKFMYYCVPMYGKFRAPTQALMLAEMAMPVLAVMAVWKLLRMTAEERKRWFMPFLIVTGIPVLLLLIFALFGPSMFSFESAASSARLPKAVLENEDIMEALLSDRASLLVNDSLRSLLFVILAGGVLALAFIPKVRIPPIVFGIALFVLVGADLIPVAYRYINKDDYRKKVLAKNVVPLKTGDRRIKETEKDIHYRVWNNDPNMFNDANTSFHHKSIGGYFPIKSRRYQELFDELVFGKGGVSMEVIRMLNTKWILQTDPKTGDNRAFMAREAQLPAPCGNAWFVKHYIVAPDANAEIEEMRHFKADSTAIIPNEYASEVLGFRISVDSTATIRLLSYDPKKMVYESKAASEQLAVFSEMHYQPGWNAYIDGQLVPHFRADYVMRAMRVPAGTRQIQFRFEPKAYYTGNKVSFYACLILFVALAGAISLSIIRRPRSPLPPAPGDATIAKK